jgi:hypothetical protein
VPFLLAWPLAGCPLSSGPAGEAALPLLSEQADWLTPQGSWSQDGAWGDWDGDGDLDLAQCNSVGGVNRVYQNEDGSLQLVWVSPEQEDSLSCAWGDWDGDGDLDLAVGNCNGQRNRVYENTGSPNPSQRLVAVWLSDEEFNTSRVAWADWDGDGDLDLATGDNPWAPIHLYENVGGDDPAERLQLAWLSDEEDCTADIDWGDFDGDGDPDLLVTNLEDLPPRLYRNDGGELVLAWTSPEVGWFRRGRWGDLDGDGLLEAALIPMEGGSPSPRVLAAGADGGLVPIWEGPPGTGRGLAWADADGDGDLDLATGHRGGAERLWRNDDGQLVQAWTSAEEGMTEQVSWGDLDGDLVPDLFVARFFGELDRLHLSRGVGLASAGWPESGQALRAVAWGDLDRDGDLDLAAAGDDGVQLTTLGPSGPEEVRQASDQPATGVALADWDGDGDLDLAVALEDGGAEVWEDPGEAGGDLELAWTGPAGDAARAVVWLDPDGDGDLDLLVAGDPSRLFRNTGADQSASRLEPWPWQGPAALAGAWGDLDGDGDPDLALAGGDEPDRLFESRPEGLILAQELEGAGSTDLAWGDVDGDGDLDLALAGEAGVRLHAHDGTALQSEPAWSSDECGATRLAWGDLDGDGDLDLATTGEAVCLWSNTGDPDEPLELLQRIEAPGRALAWADADGDADLDLAVAGDPGLALLANHRLGAASLPNNPTSVRLGYPSNAGPGSPALGASGAFTPAGLGGPVVTVPFTLFDAESDPAPELRLDYSILGPGAWVEAETSGPREQLEASPQGTPHELEWRIPDDLEGDLVVLRLVVLWQAPRFVASPILHGAIADLSAPLRVGGTCYPRDGDADGVPCVDDCDDGDPSVGLPEAEVCGDGRDQDCDGRDTPCPEGGCGCNGAPGAGPARGSVLLLLLLLGLRCRSGRRISAEAPARMNHRPRTARWEIRRPTP